MHLQQKKTGQALCIVMLETVLDVHWRGSVSMALSEVTHVPICLKQMSCSLAVCVDSVLGGKVTEHH